MISGVPWWQWALSSVLIPIILGLGAAYLGHYLSLNKARYDLRIVERRTTFDELIPALAELAASDAREVRSAYHGFGSEAEEDKARAADAEWANRRRAAITVIERVLIKGELGASPAVLNTLNALMAQRSATARNYHEDFDYFHALETDAEASQKSLDAIRKAMAKET